MTKQSEQITFLLDPGHGGIVNSKYTTSPTFDKNNKLTWKKSWYHKEGDITFFEGVFNRQIISLVKSIMDTKGMKYIDVVNSDLDVPLSVRTNTANNIFSKNKKCFYFSMHGNAQGEGKANGIEIITSIGQTKSDPCATIIMQEIMKTFPNEKYRFDFSDGDLDKEMRLFVLDKTKMPSVLLEFLFFDNLEDCKKMINPEVQKKLAEAIVSGFESIQSKNII
jgi:N-acetylmuramoyl-L-alanine amidase